MRPAGGPDGSFAADRGPEWPAATTGPNRSQYHGRELREHTVASSASNPSVAQRPHIQLVWRLGFLCELLQEA